MRRSQKRQIPSTPRNSMNLDALLEGSSGSTEPAANNAGRTQRKPKSRVIDPVDNVSSMVLRSASAASLTSFVAPSPPVATPAAPKTGPSRSARRGINPLALSSNMSDTGIGSFSSPSGESSQAGLHERNEIIIRLDRSERNRDMTIARVKNSKDKNYRRLEVLGSGGIKISFYKPKDDRAEESSDGSMNSNESTEEEELESNNDSDSEADGRGQGQGAVSVT